METDPTTVTHVQFGISLDIDNDIDLDILGDPAQSGCSRRGFRIKCMG